jgi:hypothetical protein
LVRPDRVIEITVGAMFGRDVLVAVGRRQPRAFLGDEETHRMAVALNVEAHHVRDLVDAGLGVEIDQHGQWRPLAQRTQPGVQEYPLADGSDHRRIGTCIFHDA